MSTELDVLGLVYSKVPRNMWETRQAHYYLVSDKDPWLRVFMFYGNKFSN